MTQPPQSSAPPTSTLAYLNGLTAYVIWGVVGLYFKLVVDGHGVPPFTLLSHRVIWSLVFVLVVLGVARQLPTFLQTFGQRRTLLGLTATSVLIAVNWITFIHAAGTHQLVSASLGYFLSPIATVLLGVALLGERLRVWQGVAVASAAVGVAMLVFLKAGSIWIPASLTLSWSFYALLRKRIAIGPIVGLGVETAMLFPLAVIYAVLTEVAAPSVRLAATDYALLIAAGVITAVPLICFAYAARRLPMITLGLMQYVGPTMQFIVACVFGGESVTRWELASFSFVWLGLIVFIADTVRRARIAARAEAD